MQINIMNLRSDRLSLDAAFEPGPGPQARILRASLEPGGTVDAAAAPVSATLEEVNRNADLSSLRANGSISVTIVEQATDNLSVEAQFNKLRNDVARAWQGILTVYHKANPVSIGTEVTADAADLATSIALANSLRSRLNLHLASTGDVGAHVAASAASVTSAVAVDLASAILLANEEQGDYNGHLVEAGVHINNDAVNGSGAPAAVDLPSLVVLLLNLKTVYNLHIAAANAMDSLPLGSN